MNGFKVYLGCTYETVQPIVSNSFVYESCFLNLKYQCYHLCKVKGEFCGRKRFGQCCLTIALWCELLHLLNFSPLLSSCSAALGQELRTLRKDCLLLASTPIFNSIVQVLIIRQVFGYKFGQRVFFNRKKFFCVFFPQDSTVATQACVCASSVDHVLATTEQLSLLLSLKVAYVDTQVPDNINVALYKACHWSILPSCM